MYCETTMYIRHDLVVRVDDAAAKLEISRSRLISILLLKYMENNQAGSKAFMKLKYQPRASDARYVIKSLCLRKDFYERWCDVRKAFKFSASYIIALAIELYLDDMILGRSEPFNYGFIYVTNTKYYNNMCVNTTIWGEPDMETLKKIADL